MSEYTPGQDYGSSPHFRLRLFKNRIARIAVAAGGIGVIVAILLILFYLLYVVVPLGETPEMHEVSSYPLPAESPVIYLSVEEQAEIGAVFQRDGLVRFLSTADGSLLDQIRLKLPENTEIVSFSAAHAVSGTLAFGLSNGQALVVRQRYQVSFPDDTRVITPSIEYPLGEAPVDVMPDGLPVQRLAIQEDDSFTLAGWSDNLLSLVRAEMQESMLGEDGTYEFRRTLGYTSLGNVKTLLLDPAQHNLYVISESGDMAWYEVADLSAVQLKEQLHLVAPGVKVIDARLLTGGTSIMVASDDGVVDQWFSVRDSKDARYMEKIRSFENVGGLSELVPEASRKEFMLAGTDGTVSVFHTTADKLVIRQAIADTGLRRLAVAPRSNALWALDDRGILHFWRIKNDYPEISWSALWSKVWYEGYDQPEYIWQSSSASNDFEPKLSLTPLTFGTLKAAFYAMLFAIPLAILGAIFTAYFMAPKMRQVVKPSIEIMEALPTVILGFLAGLWLAPLVESHLPGIFAIFLLLPTVVLLLSYLWVHLPDSLRGRVPEGWEALLLIPVVIGTVFLALWLSPLLELWWFDGDMPHWLKTELGIGYDQRNSLVVGLAMGFAVIPTIFSIAEDAIFSVPRHLTNGSLALGATSWQTLVRVVLLTASPGIFSGIMMGVGRAVGETMIVLMATGNTPVMDMSIFQGMRTLSANIAVEMPEAEVASTHYRVLFLAALVLFIFTFVFNTGAELVRQHLRRKYSSL